MSGLFKLLALCFLCSCATATIPGDEGAGGSDAEVGSPADASTEQCALPLTACGSDCVNTDSDEANCGDCGQPCDGSCIAGDCVIECTDPLVECGSDCIDPQSDDDYCGASGDCSGAAAGSICGEGTSCIDGTCQCVGDCGYVFEEDFINGQVSTQQCTVWNTYRAGLQSNYTSVTIYGSNDLTGITCSEPAKVTQIADGIKNETDFFVTCSGHTWSFCNRSSYGEVWVDGPAQCDLNNCPDPGYIFRICWTANLWGGVGTSTCSAAPSQTMGLRFQ